MRRRHVIISASGVFLLVFTVIFVLPVIHGIGRSIAPPNGFDNYLRVIQDQRLPRYFVNSVIVSGGIIALTVVSSTLAGYAFSKLEFPLKNVLFYVLLITLLVPFSTLIIPLFLLIRSLGLYNTYLGLILPQAAFAVPFYTVLVRNYFNSLPDELIDAAYVDGCSDFGALWRIMMPLSLPVQAIVVTLVFLSSWNNYLLPLLFLRSQEMYTVPIAAVSYAFDAGSLNTVGGIAYDSLFSALFILAAPTVIIFLLLQRVFMGSVTAGALKT